MNQRPSSPASLTARIVALVKSIPRGRVATYGQIAALAGDPRAARQVVWVLRSFSDRERLPWHRVISSSGRISLRGEGGGIQRQLLEKEGVRFDPNGLVSLELYQWKP